ncbi:hypothetical protein A3770_09p54290 [Chloropicon primus]|uniref:RWP-RK domain-containing protein n=2 Tax=Chloropicon primus TaxID=1764295 RepID=A0A5B8MRA4_9CHLO|nr:hypothetical protein A3770_09p54290 [Chloropicon primus]|eukprot:QDZ22911.1 hypothetical protein A3770_09p54290 [Chloropicon primus]
MNKKGKDASSKPKGGETKARIQKTEGKKGRPKYVIDRETLSQVFHLPFEKACEQLGIGSTTLKRICREQEIGRWPYRRLMCADTGKRKGGSSTGDKKAASGKKKAQSNGTASNNGSSRNGGQTSGAWSNLNNIQEAQESLKKDGPKGPIKRNRSFLIYQTGNVWHEQPLSLPENLPLASFFREDFLNGDANMPECSGQDDGKGGRRRVKRSRSLLLQIMGEGNSVTLSPTMAYDIPMESFETTEDLLKVFENPTSLQSALQHKPPQLPLLVSPGVPSNSNLNLNGVKKNSSFIGANGLNSSSWRSENNKNAQNSQSTASSFQGATAGATTDRISQGQLSPKTIASKQVNKGENIEELLKYFD